MNWPLCALLQPHRRTIWIVILVFLLGAFSNAEAQEITNGVYNRLSGRTGYPPLGAASPTTGSPTLTPQFANVVESSASSNLIAGTLVNGTLSAGPLVSGTLVSGTLVVNSSSYVLPNSLYLSNGGTVGVKLTRSSVGTTFSSGVPRYSLGDQIIPPTAIINSLGVSTTVAAGFWRTMPLAATELITNPSGAPAVDYHDGGPATIAALGDGVFPSYYYSPHAKAVFANTPGRVSVTWVSSIPDPTTNAYIFYKETFSVSVAARVPARKMFWTERSYTGPLITIPSGQIQRVNPVFSNVFPETVATEVVLAGDSTKTVAAGSSNTAALLNVSQQQSAILRTLWFEKLNGKGQLHAYNLTGRILIEYLGVERVDGTFEFLGLDVVDVEKSLAESTQNVELGNEIRAFDGAQVDARDSLVAAPVGTGGSAEQANYYGVSIRPDGSSAYYAEKTNDIPERVSFYWLEPLPIGINTGATTTLANSLIKWPAYLNQYTLSWPTSVSKFVQYTVDDAGSSVASGTGLQFQGGNLPQVVFQDSAEGDLTLDTITQRLVVNFTGESDLLNRSLLKFTGTNGGVWYVPLMTQGMDRPGLAAEGFSTSGTAYVGERLIPPSSDYSNAAYIAQGSCYSPQAYINPFTSGVPAAELGAIIPVNAVPGQSTLTVWWFKKIPAKSVEFSDFYTSAIVSTYTVDYRETTSTTETFNNTPVGWSDNRVLSVGPPSSSGLPSTSVLGPFSTYSVSGSTNSVLSGPATSKTFYSGAQGASAVTFAFQLYRLDSWTGQNFSVYAQTAATGAFMPVLSQTFNSATQVSSVTSGTTALAGVSYAWTIKPTAGSYADFVTVGSSSVSDQIFDVNIVATPTTNAGVDSLAALTLGFGSNLSSSAGAFAIDNLSFALSVPKIILASNQGSGALPSYVAEGTIYNQPDRSAIGYNPNEEHALILDKRAYALRDDLNVLNGSIASGTLFTSKPRVLIQYTDPTDHRPAMAVFKVERDSELQKFDYNVTAGTILNVLAPMPLPLLPLPGDPVTGLCKNVEVDPGSAFNTNPDVAAATGSPAVYSGFTYKDRKGYDWIYRGPHDEAKSPALGMKYFYTMRANFVFPGLTTQPAVGTALPYLRPVNDSGAFVGDPVTGSPLTVVYRPTWPSSPPTLSVGETLTLAKNGLPGVRGQSSAQVLYQQSIALSGTLAPSVTLTDPTRAKTVLLNAAGVGLTALPSSLKTTIDQGKIYFQLAQPHIQKRICFNPQLGDKGGIVFSGEFIDEIAGEDYLNLNTLSAADALALKGLVSQTDVDYAKWGNAIDALSTTVQTYVANPSKAGTYIPDPNQNIVANAYALPQVPSSNTAVDTYALTALGKGSGYVTLLFGNGTAFTPIGDPVTIQIVKVVDRLYKGDLKTIFSANPLDEQTTLRHSGDFAAHPEYYDFQWRYIAQSTAPAVYSYGVQRVLGVLGVNNQWQVQSTPTAVPSVSEPLTYSAAASTFPYTLSTNAASYDNSSGLPGKMLLNTGSLTCLGSVPNQILFSAQISDSDGFVLFVNNTPALAYNLPTGVTTPGVLSITSARVGLVSSGDGLDRQFDVDPKVFKLGANRIEIALYSSSAAPSAASLMDFRIHIPSKTDLVTSGTAWTIATGTLSNTLVLGGAAGTALGNPLLVFSDAFFTMRYRAKAAIGMITGGTAETDWSEWVEPAFVPSWVKRVLAGINPFNQRETDLQNNPISTDVSVLTQAGKRWEGDVALSLQSINNFGLIEIYETVLNRVKSQSLDANVTTEAVNNTLLLVAGYLNDLYMLLGNEAADDAANPTIQIDGQSGAQNISSARFSFEGQVPTLLDETLALWRGRDDINTTTQVAPAYNRLYWNYIKGINSGEPIYAVNYDIKDQTGTAANGVIDASDAQKIFPQGHGDAYGHYLTSLKGYYKLLTNQTFTWIPSAETASVLGQSVQVDYQDERKFAAAAAAVAKAGCTTLSLTARKNFQDTDANGWSSLSEAEFNGNKGTTRYWGTDEWAGRSYQGAYFNWINANAMLPVVDSTNQGIAKVDRTTVPELAEIATTANKIFTISAGLQANINPLGLAADSMTFDISPSELAAGKTHFEQIYDRAVQAGINAKESFIRAGQMDALLREQANGVDNYAYDVAKQESNYQYDLINLFGTPYAGDIGVGALYAQGYSGPDLYHSFFINKPSDLIDTSNDVTVSFREPVNITPFATWDLDNVYSRVNTPVEYISRTFNVSKFSLAQFATTAMGNRQQVGEIQTALLDCYQAQVNLRASVNAFNVLKRRFDRDYQLYSEMITGFNTATAQANAKNNKAAEISNASFNLTLAAAGFGLTVDYVAALSNAFAEAAPTSVGFSTDVTSVIRSLAKYGGATASYAYSLLGLATETKASLLDAKAADLQSQAQGFIDDFNTQTADKQHVSEFERLYAQMLSTAFDMNLRLTELQQATERVSKIYGKANQILAQRETFRTRAASVVQGYRTRDVVYRNLRNEQLSQYSALFDLAQTYTYCAVKAYDYETGLLKTASGRNFTNAIISNWSIGEFSGQNPVSAKLGDPGLAGVLAAVREDWAVAKGRLGYNNPDRNGTLFSLRQELFRIRTDQASSEDNMLWRQVLQQKIMSNVLSDPDVLKYCANISKANGGAVPGIVIPFFTTIAQGVNFFGWPLAAGDHSYSQSTFATKILSAGVLFNGYVGMDVYGGGAPLSSGSNALSANPYVYLIPAGLDSMRTPALGDKTGIRTWAVKDQALPLPINIGGNGYSAIQLFSPQGTLNEQLWIPRKHQAFRAVDNAGYFYSSMPAEFTNSRLVGRSVWNSAWKLVIPAYSLLNNEQAGMDNFLKSVSDIRLFLRTYSNSGN